METESATLPYKLKFLVFTILGDNVSHFVPYTDDLMQAVNEYLAEDDDVKASLFVSYTSFVSHDEYNAFCDLVKLITGPGQQVFWNCDLPGDLFLKQIRKHTESGLPPNSDFFTKLENEIYSNEDLLLSEGGGDSDGGGKRTVSHAFQSGDSRDARVLPRTAEHGFSSD